MTRTWKIVFSAFVVAAFAGQACGSDDSTPPGDVKEAAEGVTDVIFPDNCQCKVAADCDGKVQLGVCTQADCAACECVAKPRPLGTVCNDGDAQTVDDACNSEGECVGVPTSCGNQQCEDNEDCGNCLADCPCGLDEYCKGGECIKRVCGNGECEPGESCETCDKDCGCKEGEACHEEECTACADYCTSTGKECGEAEGCDCGECAPGFDCDGFNHCYNATICNNGKCEEGENCGNCITDCPCESGQKCDDGECKECAPICEDAEKECGFYNGCDCGSCAVCYKCDANQCNPKCDCVCWQKECGEIGPCKCGPLDGACPGTQDCVGFKCLEGCDTLCAGVECGWSQECICDWCEGCEACQDNTCGPGAGIDEYDVPPYNDFPSTATDMGATTDDNAESAMEFTASIDVDFDEDWYKVEVSDVAGHVFVPHVELLDLQEDKDLDLEVCFVCKYGEVAGVAPKPADMVFETESALVGARCFVSMLNLWGQSELVELDQITCDGDPQDDSGIVYVHVYPAFDDDCGASYTVKWNM